MERLDRLDREKRVEKLDSGRGFAEGLERFEVLEGLELVETLDRSKSCLSR